MAILSEAYSHADFRTRVQVTHDFLVEILNYAAAHADEIRRIEREADRQTTLEGAGAAPRPDLAVQYRIGLARRRADRARSDAADGRHVRPAAGRSYEPTGQYRTVRIPANVLFVDSVSRPLPAGYFLPAGAADVASLLRLHGIQVERLEAPWTDTVETVAASQITWSPREFQGHQLVQVTATYVNAARTLPAGSFFVTTAQPLGPPGLRAPRAGGVGARAVGPARPPARLGVRDVLGAGLRIRERARAARVTGDPRAAGSDARHSLGEQR